MIKHIIALSTAVMLLSPLVTQAGAPGKVVEIMLISYLDEARGYCLDIAGGKGASAPLDKGLQAHTCYHYTGGILEDQGFDSALVSQGQFRIPYFDVCMSVPSIAAGVPITLGKCSKADTQKFTLKSSGHLVTQVNPKLCVTVSSAEKKEGRGGTPIHVMRPLSLQPCEDAKESYQTWSTRELKQKI